VIYQHQRLVQIIAQVGAAEPDTYTHGFVW
jgi:hypothetical protein